MNKKKFYIKKLQLAFILLVAFSVLVACINKPVTRALDYKEKTTYRVVVEGFEWGPSVTKMIVSLNEEVSSRTLDENSFVVKAEDTTRSISKVYLSNEKGEKIDNDRSKHFTVAMKVGFDSSRGPGFPTENSGAFTTNEATQMSTWRDLAIYSLSLDSNQFIVIDGKQYTNFNVEKNDFVGRLVPQIESIRKGTFTHENITLNYAAYETETLVKDNNKNPLIIWLHGKGEGGTDIDTVLLGNQVSNLWSHHIQDNFKANGVSGAYVLAVQSPTKWMDSAEGTQMGNNSMYTEALIHTINYYVDNNPDVDTRRIYLGGCSNGGYMAMNLLFNQPNYYAAVYPIAQAFSDAEISDEMIQAIQDTPIWFVHSENDFIVRANDFVKPTYARLIQAGADRVHFSYYKEVVGLDAPGLVYNGHLSWIYALQDRVFLDQDRTLVYMQGEDAVIAPSAFPVFDDEGELSLWKWIANQRIE